MGVAYGDESRRVLHQTRFTIWVSPSVVHDLKIMLRLSHILCLLLLIVATYSWTQPIEEDRPIFMERREASAFGDIIGELKGKGLGGRMRFGKRSSSPDMRLAELRAIYGGAPLELVQY